MLLDEEYKYRYTLYSEVTICICLYAPHIPRMPSYARYTLLFEWL